MSALDLRALMALARKYLETVENEWPDDAEKPEHGAQTAVVEAFERAFSDRAAHVLVLEEGQRQLVLRSLAVASLRAPGFDDALNRIALRMDNLETNAVGEQRAALYDNFRKIRADVDLQTTPPTPVACPACGYDITPTERAR